MELGMMLLVLGGFILGMVFVFTDEYIRKYRAVIRMRRQIQEADRKVA